MQLSNFKNMSRSRDFLIHVFSGVVLDCFPYCLLTVGSEVIWGRAEQGKGNMISQFLPASISIRHGNLWNRQFRERGDNLQDWEGERKGSRGWRQCFALLLFFKFIIIVHFIFIVHFKLREIRLSTDLSHRCTSLGPEVCMSPPQFSNFH